jgi:hypothetical protein
MSQNQRSPACGCMGLFAVGGAIVGFLIAPEVFGPECGFMMRVINAGALGFGGVLLATWLMQKLRMRR